MQNEGMKRVYLASKMLLTDLEKKELERTCFEMTEHGGLPIAPALYLARFLDHDSDSARIMQVSIGLLEMCEELWLLGDLTHFQLEVGAAKSLGIVVRCLESGAPLPNDLLHFALN